MTLPEPTPTSRRRPVLGLVCCFCFLAAGCAADTDFIDFSTLARSSTPNDALACPAGFCPAKVDLVTGTVPLAAAALSAKVIETLANEPRTELVARDAAGLKLVFVQRSRLFRFPDTVNIAITPIGGDAAGLAIYSRSNYGHGDLGVNAARVQDWLAKFGVPAGAN
ncbi:DUF1499 domain-containing protein [Dongia mobilis]|uniref:DUF1499 domain-containing protein n=1 Tax=Dongia sp. TaxID=1977262 RepID=UPI0026EA3222